MVLLSFAELRIHIFFDHVTLHIVDQNMEKNDEVSFYTLCINLIIKKKLLETVNFCIHNNISLYYIDRGFKIINLMQVVKKRQLKNY